MIPPISEMMDSGKKIFAYFLTGEFSATTCPL